MNNIWDEIIEEAQLRSAVKLADELTTQEFATKTGLHIAKARKYLIQLYKDGEVTKRWVFHDGATRLAYKPIEA